VPYRYRDDIATADVAFEVWGESLEEVFAAAADATMNVMVEDISTIGCLHQLTVELGHDQLDLLLFSFLNELIFLKDARKLLLRVQDISIGMEEAKFALKSTLCGEMPDAGKHRLATDVKAVTLHRFSLDKTESGWQAFVILDI
jgi:SHS2 domain-containing protein